MKIHIAPDFQHLLPEQSPEELELLEKNVAADKRHEVFPPILIWGNHHNTLVDGHHQHKFRVKHGCQIKYAKRNFESRAEAMLFAFHIQLGRRNLSASQRAMIVAKLPNARAGRPANSGEKGENSPITISAAAKVAGVNVETMKQAVSVEKNASPEVKRAVADGKVSVSDAASVATKPKPEQRQALKQVESGKAKTLAKATQHPQRPELVGLKKLDEQLGRMIRAAADINKDLAPSKHYDEFKRGLDIACQALQKWRQASK